VSFLIEQVCHRSPGLQKGQYAKEQEAGMAPLIEALPGQQVKAEQEKRNAACGLFRRQPAELKH
jgi:hypothetical protein